uniref:Transmembrane protein n=1 Tax=Syphacia muris TaxID=451379 RepID=A0A0N5AI79_9BILA
MVGRPSVRSRHHGANRTSQQHGSLMQNNNTSAEGHSKSDEVSGLTVQIHPSWPDMAQGQGELFFECTLFLYSVLALFLEYLNLYKTLWWLPKSHWSWTMKFHLINPYLLSCVGLLLGMRVTKCFWNTITKWIAGYSQGASGTLMIFWKMFEWLCFKIPMFLMVASSFMFSFSRVYADYSTKSLIYFCFPLVIFVIFFFFEIAHAVHRFISMVHYALKVGGWEHITSAPLLYPQFVGPAGLLDIDNVAHMCSTNPVQIREEVSILSRDFNLRLKHCIFSGLFTAYFSIFIPYIFTPEKSPSGIPQKMYIDGMWVAELFVIVAFTAFSLYTTYVLPLQYGDLLHRSAVHLGTWKRIDVVPGVINNSSNEDTTTYPHWSEHQNELYPDRKEVQHGGHIYRAYAVSGAPGVAAIPGDLEHLRFSRLASDPLTIVTSMCILQAAFIFVQFVLVLHSIEWQHIITLVLPMCANYTVLYKVLKDRIIISRIYNPSRENLELIKSLQQEAQLVCS